ncbi:MAG TPA: alanine--glyoxylate aminotransferase family protein [Ktedonobacterales bacterium]|nr:alanine--glyoxylate aminotransferase family protein [Ktedonobacterales bacterium]
MTAASQATASAPAVYAPVEPPERLLMGPGPSNPHPAVLRAAAAPVLGHLDPAYLAILGETTDMLRQVFGTSNALTLAVPGTGFSGMEASLCNLLEPGDTLLVGAAGFFGAKMAEIGARCGANVTTVTSEWGSPISADALRSATRELGQVKAIAVVLAETSTGVRQPLADIAALAHEIGALLVVDAVTALGGMPIPVDELELDAVYSCTQKCLGALPGLAPITLSARAVQAIEARKQPVQSWYLDLLALQRYWNPPHAYHHTSNVSLVYALHTALRLTLAEGLDARHARHALNGAALRAGAAAIGMKPLADSEHQLSMVAALRVPDGVSDVIGLRKALLEEDGIEIGGGLGDYASKVWRVGVMGYNAEKRNILHILSAFERLLPRFGHTLTAGAGVAAAEDVYARQPAEA